MKVGLFGGRFDPPHLGHLLVAEQAREALDLDEVVFVPAGAPPHKGAQATPEQRLAMTRLATEDNPSFRVDDREVRRDGPSYAVDTVLEHLRERPDDTFWFLIGADAYADIADWHRPRALLTAVTMVVVPRPGTDRAKLDALDEPFRSAARHLEIVPFGVSSTLLRRRARAGRSLRYLAPEPVMRFVRTHGLYRCDTEERA